MPPFTDVLPVSRSIRDARFWTFVAPGRTDFRIGKKQLRKSGSRSLWRRAESGTSVTAVSRGRLTGDDVVRVFKQVTVERDKPTDNVVIKSCNGRLCDECLNQHSCSGQPDPVGVRRAGSRACPATGPVWRTPRLDPSWGGLSSATVVRECGRSQRPNTLRPPSG